MSLGLSNVLFGLPLAVAVAHNAGGAALLLTLVLVNYHARTALVQGQGTASCPLAFQPSATGARPDHALKENCHGDLDRRAFTVRRPGATTWS
jgi:hypothetical protein